MATQVTRALAFLVMVMFAALSTAPAAAAPPPLPVTAVFNITQGSWVITSAPSVTVFPATELNMGCHDLSGPIGELQPAITIDAGGSLSGGCDDFQPGVPQFPGDVIITGVMNGSMVPATGVVTFTYSTIEKISFPSTGAFDQRALTFSGSTTAASTNAFGGSGTANFTVARTCEDGTDTGRCLPRHTYTYSGTVGFSFSFSAPTSNDTKIDHVELLQVVQTQDNVVPLVADKSTVARVFLKSPFPRLDVTVTLKGKRGVQQLGSLTKLPGSASSALPDFDAEQSFASFNFLLPDSWVTAGTIFLEAEVTFTQSPGDLPDPDMLNNKQSLNWTFQARKQLSVGYIPICVKGEADGCPDDGIAEMPQIINRLFPISNEGIVYQRIQSTSLEIDALPITSRDVTSILVRLQKRTALAELYSESKLPDQIAGWIKPNSAEALGRAHTLDAGGDGRASFNVFNPAEPGDSRATLAHEIAHNLGRKHTNKPDGCNAKDTTTDWPYVTSTIQEPGWDFGTNDTIYSNKFDLMSYCFGFNGTNIWISPYTFTHLFEANGVPGHGITPQADSPTTYLVISGVVLASGAGAGLELATTVTSTATVPALPGTGTHCIWFDAQPTGHCFDLAFYDYEEDVPLPVQEFLVTVPAPAGGFSSYRLCKFPCGPGDTLVDVAKTANAPAVEITSPLPGSSFGGEATLTWTAGDADNDVLRYTVLHSSDGGANWIPLLADAAVTSYTFDAEMLAAGPGGKFRVLASDGAWTSAAEVENITVGTARPWGDLQCDGDLDLSDVLAGRRAIAGLGTSAAIGCPAAGGLAQVAGIEDAMTWGDFRCDGEVDATDVLGLLRVLAGFSAASGAGECPAIGEPVFVSG